MVGVDGVSGIVMQDTRSSLNQLERNNVHTVQTIRRNIADMLWRSLMKAFVTSSAGCSSSMEKIASNVHIMVNV